MDEISISSLHMKTGVTHLQPDGMAERYNRSIINYFSLFVLDIQGTGTKLVIVFLLSYTYSIRTHLVYQYTPSISLTGGEKKFPMDLIFGSPAGVCKRLETTSQRNYLSGIEVRFDHKAKPRVFEDSVPPQRKIGYLQNFRDPCEKDLRFCLCE